MVVQPNRKHCTNCGTEISCIFCGMGNGNQIVISESSNFVLTGGEGSKSEWCKRALKTVEMDLFDSSAILLILSMNLLQSCVKFVNNIAFVIGQISLEGLFTLNRMCLKCSFFSYHRSYIYIVFTRVCDVVSCEKLISHTPLDLTIII